MIETCSACYGSGKAAPKTEYHGPMLKCRECDGSGEQQSFRMYFWRYDFFPYVLGSRGFMVDDERCYCPDRDEYVFPIKDFSLEEGAKLLKALETLSAEQRKIVDAAQAKCVEKLKALVPWIPC